MKIRQLLPVLLAITIVSCQNKASEKQQDQQEDNRTVLERAEIPYLVGESKQIFDAKPAEGFEDTGKWFTNDHCFVADHEGNMHWIGINNPYPPEGKELYVYHPYLGHFINKDSTAMKGWERLPFALDESKDTEYLGAPFVIWHDESSRWAMIVETKLEGIRRLEVCWSKDLLTWERTRKAIHPDKLWIASRDPHIIKGDDGKYWIHIVSTGNKGVKQSQVLRIKTKDFVTFEDPETILGINDNNFATLMESPMIYKRNGLWYLFFTYAHRRYTETIVVVSDTPDHFNYYNNTVTTLFGHASKIFEYKGKSYISSCGPENTHYASHQSISLAEIKWLEQQ